MVINHNLTAMNAQRNMGINSGSAAKSMEKLSSGLKINRAGDNAAGLSISEKMRGQIRGLNQASSNAEDGISMIQTAEGALNETHSILQRMRELAVQAGNDTNADTDREAIQSEMDQLSSEINRIGNTTEFNTQKLLNGDKASGVQTLTNGSDASKAGLKNFTVGDATDVQVDYGTSGKEGNIDILFTEGTDATVKASWNTDGKLVVALGTTSSNNTADKITEAIRDTATDETATSTAANIPAGVDASKITVSSASKGVTGINATKIKAGYDAGELSGAKSNINGTSSKVTTADLDTATAGDQKATFTYSGVKASELNGYKIKFASGTTAADVNTDTKEITLTVLAAGDTKANIDAALKNAMEAKGFEGTLTIDANVPAIAGDKLNTSAFTFADGTDGTYGSKASLTGTVGNSNFTLSSATNNSLGNMKVKFASGAANGVGYDSAKDTLTITLEKGKKVSASQINGLLSGDTTVVGGTTQLKDLGITIDLDESIDTDKVKGLYGQESSLTGGKTETAGVYSFGVDKQDLTIDGTKLTYNKDAASDSTTEFSDAKSLAKAINGNVNLRNKYDATVTDDGKLQLTQKKGYESSTAPEVTGIKDNSVTIQLGANENQTSSIGMNDNRSKSLGVTSGTEGAKGFREVKSVNDGTNNTSVEYSLDVSDSKLAGNAVTVIQSAIEKVSAQRSSLGAYQNRLEHTINNLGTSSENLTSAESRIRDTDMASEMNEYSKNNILQQAAQAMLAQAKSAPQSVLQLLQ